MKALLNWRYYVITALLAVGMYAVMAMFADDTLPMLEWAVVRILLATVAAVTFLALGRLIKHWMANGEIPEITNYTNQIEHGDQN